MLYTDITDWINMLNNNDADFFRQGPSEGDLIIQLAKDTSLFYLSLDPQISDYVRSLLTQQFVTARLIGK